MRSLDLGYSLVFAGLMLAGSVRAGDIDPKGLVALQRVIDARNSQPDVSVELRMEIVGQGYMTYRIHSLGDQLRVDEFDKARQVSAVFVDGDTAWGYRFDKHSDLHKSSAKKIRSLGYVVFWPRVLGVTTFLNLDSTLEDLLYSDADAIRVLPRQPVIGVDNGALEAAGVELDVVEVDRGVVTLSNAIESLTGRIYRRNNYFNHLEDSAAISVYESKDNPEWLPSKVTIVLGGRQEVLSEIRCVSTSPDPMLFDLRTFGIRPGTSVVDVAMQRRIGTWNGETIVDLDHGRRPERLEGPESGASWTSSRGVAVALTLVLLAALLAVWTARRLSRDAH